MLRKYTGIINTLRILKFYSNPLRSFSHWPRFMVDNDAWGKIWPRLDSFRQQWFEHKNKHFRYLYKQEPPVLSSTERHILDTVEREGICILPDFLNGRELSELRRITRTYFEQKRGVQFEGFHPRVTDLTRTSSNKNYLVRIEGDELQDQCPLVHYSIRPDFVNIANNYLKIYALLRSVNMWLNLPLGGPERNSQLWHWDGSDFRTLKIFTYLTDVSATDGPFCYLPGTHYHGYNRHLVARMKNHFSSKVMADRIPEAQWLFCTGKAGSVVFADTSGLHRGGRCERGSRILLQAEYTGHFPWQPQVHDYSRHQFEGLKKRQEIALKHY